MLQPFVDQEMGDALTGALDGFTGDANVRVVVVTGGAPWAAYTRRGVAIAGRQWHLRINGPTNSNAAGQQPGTFLS
jgi:hypothetical protein